MNDYLQCDTCGVIELETEIPIETSRNHEMVCGWCCNKNSGFVTVNTCENCEELTSLVDGIDLCFDCYQSQNPAVMKSIFMEQFDKIIADLKFGSKA